MTKIWSDAAWDDYLYWQNGDRKNVNRINKLLKSVERNAFDGIGKPEPLRYDLQGYWSVRIDDTNRIVYKIENNCLYIISCRYHYDKR